MRLRALVLLTALVGPAHANSLLDIHRASFAAFMAVATAAPGGDPTANLLPNYNDAYANWSIAGVPGGIPNYTTQCGSTLPASGVVPPAGGDDYAHLTAAITACPAGQFILLGTGTFNFDLATETIFLNKGIVIRGSGSVSNSCSTSAVANVCWPTVLQQYNGPWPKYVSNAQCGVTIGSTTNCPNPSAGFINIGPATGPFAYGWGNGSAPPAGLNPTTSNLGTTFTANAVQGDTTIHVTSTANFSVGMWVLIDESPNYTTFTNSVTGGAAPCPTTSLPGSPELQTAATLGSSAIERFACGDQTGNWGGAVDRQNSELHKVSSIGAGTVTFDSPLTIAFRTSHDARAYWPTFQNSSTPFPFISGAGIENLSVRRASGGGINFEFCTGCWAHNVDVGYWTAGAINLSYTSRSSVTHNYMHDCIDCQNNGQEYPLGVDLASTENLIDDNIILFGGKGMVGRGSSANVVAYNYVDKSFYETISGQIGDYWNDMGLNGSHYAGTHHWLFEGNWGPNCDDDDTHGSANLHTYYRNDCNGYRTAFTDPSIATGVDDVNNIGWTFSGSVIHQDPGPLRAAGPMAWNYWDAYVGNVLGSPSTTTGNGWAYICTTYISKCIWFSGWTGAAAFDNNLSGASNVWIFKHADYDFVHGSVFDFASGSVCGNGVACSHTLADSFYLAAQPSYFGTSGANCTYPWPWVTPTSGTVLQTPTGGSCTATSGLPAKARWEAGTPFVQP